MTLLDRSSGMDALHSSPDIRASTQVGALCYRVGKSGIEVLLITSSRGRWIIPKGWPINGLSLAKSARQEAWEEAGVHKGKLRKKPLGRYVSHKHEDDGTIIPCDVHVFAIKVKKTRTTYPEVAKRDRKWVPLRKARDMVDEKDLRKILKGFSPKIKSYLAKAA